MIKIHLHKLIFAMLIILAGVFTASLAYAAITYVGSASNPGDPGPLTTSPVAVTPPSMQEGDLVVMMAQVRDTATTMTISQDGGQIWNTEAQQNATAIRTRLFWSTFNGTWSANPSVAMGTTNNTVVMHVFRPDGDITGWTLDVAQASANFAAPTLPYTVTIPQITTQTDGALALAFWGSADDNTWATTSLPVNWTTAGKEQYRNTSGSGSSITAAYRVMTTAGGTGSVTKNQVLLAGDAGRYNIIAFKERPPLTHIYRSVGPGATALIDDDSKGTTTISGGIASFASALSNNVGVGDVLLYDSNNSNTLTSADSIAFIHSRIDSTHFTVRTETGTTTSDLTSNDTWEIYRAYTSLANAEAGTINSTLSGLGLSFSGGDEDLVTNNQIWNIACYASTTADTTAFTIDGWNTSHDNYLHIFTPVNSNEVGTSQRHDGKWNTSRYRLEASFSTDSQIAIAVQDNFVYIDGLQVRTITSGTIGGFIVAIYVNPANESTDGGTMISNTIVRNTISSGSVAFNDGIYIDGPWYLFVWNSIAYDFVGGTGGGGIIAGDNSPTMYVYNSTSYNGNYCFQQSTGTGYAKNNIAQNCSTGYSGAFDGSSEYNISDLNDAPGTNTKNSTNVTFQDEANDDFHLSILDTAAYDNGVDLSADAVNPFNTDIDGTVRDDWDIGADEGIAMTKIYRSVGANATTTLATDAAGTNTLTIVSGVASFGSPLPTNIGLGDVILYDSNDSGTLTSADSIAFIHGRNSSVSFNVKTHAGATPADMGTANDKWAIYRAHTSLANAESGTVNSTLNTLSITYNGGNRNLVTNTEQWNIVLYANGTSTDSSNVVVDGWTTGASNYIKIFTPVASNEVGETQRHLGIWDSSKYSLYNTSANSAIEVSDQNVYIDGLQINEASSASSKAGIYFNTAIVYNVRVSNNIIKGSGASTGDTGIKFETASAGSLGSAYNNIIYDFNDTSGVGINTAGANFTTYIYNNTVSGSSGTSGIGISKSAGVSVAKNNIVQASTDGYSGTFASSTNNISHLASDAPGTNPKNSTTVTFEDSANKDFHLSVFDTQAKNSGVDLSSDIYMPFNTDIDGETRVPTWDIGADESYKTKDIYRSVGFGVSAPIDDSTKGSTTISGGIATFDNSLENNVGVGDVLLYDSNNSNTLSSADSIAFIHGRIDSTHYTVRTHTGAVPGDLTANDTWEIYRAHESMQDAEDGVENTTLSTLGFSYNGGNRNLVTNNEVWNVACYSNGTGGETGGVTVTGWTSSATNYIKFYTPVNLNEVGETQRHSGVWDESKFFMDNVGIDVTSGDVVIDGLQIHVLNGVGATNNIIARVTTETLIISNNILRFTDLSDPALDPIPYGIFLWEDTVDAYIYNNIIYGFIDDTETYGIGINIDVVDEAWVYNNTITNSVVGINKNYNYPATLKNNLAFDCVTGYSGTFQSGSTNNLSGPSTSDAPGSNPINSATPLFMDYANDDFHLALSDTVARSAGANLTYDVYVPFSTDVDGQARNKIGTGWDVGADEGTREFVTTVMESGGEYSSLALWEAGLQSDLKAVDTMLFAHGGITGTISDISSVIGLTSGATADVVHAGASQILLENILGSFVSGETVQVSVGNSVVISDNGNPASVVAKIDGAWGGADVDPVDLSGWGNGRNNYIRIYTTPSARHMGVWDDAKYRLEYETTDQNQMNMYVGQDFSEIDGLQFFITNGWYNGRAITSDGQEIKIGNNIIKAVDGNYSVGIYKNSHYPVMIYNNVIYGFNDQTGPSPAIQIAGDGLDVVYNNTMVDNALGVIKAGGPGITVTNNLVQDSLLGYFGSVTSESSNNISNRDDAPGVGSINSATVTFLDKSNYDYHLSQSDVVARNRGVNLSSDALLAFDTDIDGSPRMGSVNSWDIGADEAPTAIFRSVGPSNTTAIATGTSNALTIPGGVQRTGSLTEIHNSANSGSQAVTVPADAEMVVVGISGFYAELNFYGGGSVTLGGNALTVGYTTDYELESEFSAIFYAVNPSTGSQTLAWDWSGANVPEGTHIYVTFYKGVDTTNPLRSTGGQNAPLTTSASTGVLSANNGDKVVAVQSGFFETGISSGVVAWTGATEIDDDVFNNNIGSIAEATTTGDVTVTATISGGSGQAYMSISAIVIRSSVSPLGKIASFASALPNTVGVGDILQYDSDNNSTIDALAVISGRNSDKEYYIQTVSGATPNSMSIADNNWSIYRAYTSLANAEKGVENSGITSGLRNLDDWTSGGDATTDDVGKNLLTNNEQWNIACYGDATETASTTIDGWSTGEQNYIKVYTPVSAGEVGVSQRHSGVWDSGKFKIVSDQKTLINIFEPNTRIEGLQIQLTGSINESSAIGASTSNTSISANLLTGGDSNAALVAILNDTDNTSEDKIYNNIFYYAPGMAIVAMSTSSVYIYNNTFSGVGAGIVPFYGDVYAVNNVLFNNAIDFFGSFYLKDYNASDSGEGSHAIDLNYDPVKWERSFVDYYNNDYRIKDVHSLVYNAGTPVSFVTNDIIGTGRPYYNLYDIGAFEFVDGIPGYKFSPGGNFKMKGYFKFE